MGNKILWLVAPEPVRYGDRFAEDRHERRMPTMDEFRAVADIAPTEQDRTMLWAYLHTGARREELFRLRWKDVDFKEKQIRLFGRKNQKGQWRDSWLPVRAELLSLLRARQKVTGFMSLVFLNFNGSNDPKFWVPYKQRQHWLGNLCELAEVEPFGFHGIRHLFASILASENVPLPEIQAMLRHQNLTTTQRYIHRLKTKNREVLRALPDLEIEKRPDQKVEYFSKSS